MSVYVSKDMEILISLSLGDKNFRILLFFIFIFMFMCVYTPYVCRCPKRPDEGVGAPGTGFTGGYDPSGVGAGSQTKVLCKSN